MEDIIKLIEITRKKGHRSIQLVNQNFRKKEISKDNQLFEAIVAGKINDDEEAAKELFNSDPGNRNYRNAKTKLKEKLFNQLFFLDYEKENCPYYDRIKYQAQNAIIQCKIMAAEGAEPIAIKVLPYWIKLASDIELTEVVIDGLQILKIHYATTGKLSQFEEVSKDLQKYQQFQTELWKCEDLYYNSLAALQKSVHSQNKIIPQLPARLKELKATASKYKSNKLLLIAYQLELYYNTVIQNFEGNIKICEEVEKKFLDKSNEEIKVDVKRKSICIYKIQAYYALRKYTEGNKYVENCLPYFNVGADEWFKVMEYNFLMLIKNANYKQAAEVYRKVRTSKFYTLQTNEQKER